MPNSDMASSLRLRTRVAPKAVQAGAVPDVRPRRYGAQRLSRDQKLAIVRECLLPGRNVEMVAHQHAMNPSVLVHWIRLYACGTWRMGMSSVTSRTN
jgi:transposase-like protein